MAEEFRTGHTSTLVYAGYEPIMIGVGERARDWVAGKRTGKNVLDLADQLQAEANRLAAGADVGPLSLGGCHGGVENPTGVCGKLFKGDITQMIANAIPPAYLGELVCVLTLTGGEIRSRLETGLVVDPEADGFPFD